jgi:hypothetical protein
MPTAIFLVVSKMKVDYKYVVILVAVIIIGLLGYFLYVNYEKAKALNNALENNNLAYQDTLKKISENYYQHMIMVEDLSKYKDSLLNKMNEKLLSISYQQIKIKDLINAIPGNIIVNGDTNNNCKGMVIAFPYSNEFYTALDTFVLGDKPVLKRNMSFKPFGLTVHLARDEKGKWDSFFEVEKPFNKYLDIQNGNVVVDKDLFGIVSVDKNILSLYPSLGLSLINAKAYLGIGGGVILFNNIVNYLWGGKNNHFISYGYKFSIL